MLAWSSVVVTICFLNKVGAQEGPVFHTVFEFLAGSDAPLPILKKFAVDSRQGDTFDGTSTMDSYGGLERYDSKRLVLAIRENGINEQDPHHDKALAEAYPDRSLVWIDDQTGEPLGVALVVGSAPVSLDQEFLHAGGTVADYFFSFGVADDGVVFVGYKNTILRYAPEEGGGFGSPTIAYREMNDGSDRYHEPDGRDLWHQWRWETFRVRGEGEGTVLIAGGKTWRRQQQSQVFETQDGIAFEPVAPIVFQGGTSHLIPARPDDGTPTEWILGTAYPGGSDGINSRALFRGTRNLDMGGRFIDIFVPIFIDPDPEPGGYVPQFITDVDVNADFAALVSYSTPSWNSIATKGEYDPGWIAVHDFDGTFIHAHQLNITEESELIEEYGFAQWHGTLGKVEVNVLEGMKPGTAEILWYSGIYGYGRYLYGTTEEPERSGIDESPIEINVGVNEGDINLVWPSKEGHTYVVERTNDLRQWSELSTTVSSGGAKTTLKVGDTKGKEEYYRVHRK